MDLQRPTVEWSAHRYLEVKYLWSVHMLLLSIFVHSSVVSTLGSSLLEVDLLVLLPLSESFQNVTPSWERGPEILPGGALAVEHVNSNPAVLQDVHLSLQVVAIERCDADTFTSNIHAIIPFADIAEGTANASRILGLIGGPFCPVLLKRLVSPLASQPAVSLLQISGSTSENAHNKMYAEINHLNFITPSVRLYYEAVFSLMHRLKWRRLFVLAEDFFQNAANIQGSDGLNITFRQLNFEVDFVFQDLRRSAKKIVFASVSVQNAVRLLCRAQNETFIYPHYIWLFSDISAATVRKFNTICERDAMEEALKNVFFLTFPFQPKNLEDKLVSGYNYLDYYNEYLSRLPSGSPNPYANVLYDSVWAFALSLNSSISSSNQSANELLKFNNKPELVHDMDKNLKNVSFEGASGSIDFSALEVNAVVEISLSGVSIATYLGTSPSISLNDSLLSTLPSDELDRRYSLIPVPLALVLAFVVCVFLLLTTVMLALFLYFRNDPEIKATSPNLSYVMFVGCYLLFGSTLLHSLTGAFPIQGHLAVNSVCGIVIIGDSLGVNVIFTTLLLRMLRIYRVFSYFGKTGKIWSDKAMFMIIVLVISGDVILILVWSLVDTFRVIEVVVYHPLANPPYFEIRQFCHSDNLSVWLGILLGKLGILFMAVLVLAIKTRKISHSNFKDTKKVNAYIFVTVMVVIFPMAMYSLLRATDNVLGTYLTIYMVFGMVGLLCQIFLFLPKVSTPILKRHGYEVVYNEQKRRVSIAKQQPQSLHLARLMRTSYYTTSTSSPRLSI